MFRYRWSHRLLLCSALLFAGWVADPCLAKDRQSSAVAGSGTCRYVSGQVNATYVGSDICKGCHEEKYNQTAASRHWQKMTSLQNLKLTGMPPEQGCESCHGPGSAHVEGGGDKALIFNFPPFSYDYCNPCRTCHTAASMFSSGSADPPSAIRPRPRWIH